MLHSPLALPPRVGPQQIRLNRSSQFFPGLVGWWPVGNRACWGADTLLDASLNANDGALTNMDAGTDYVLGERAALDFDGTNDYVNCGTTVETDLSTGFTLAAWVKWTRGGTQADEETLIARWKGSPQADKMYLFRWDSDTSSLEFFLANSSSSTSLVNTSNTDISDGEWHHVCATYDGATMRVCLDGEVSPTTASHTGTNSSPGQVDIAGDTRDGGALIDEFQGCIDDVRIYNRALSAAEVRQLYKETKDGTYGSLEAPTGLQFFPANVGAAAATNAEYLIDGGLIDHGLIGAGLVH